MNNLHQIIIAARNDDLKGWTQLLVFVLLAVFWTISGILKARSNKLKQQKNKAEPGQPGGLGGLRTRPVVQVKPPQRRVSRPKPVRVPSPVVRGVAAAAPKAEIVQPVYQMPSAVGQPDLTKPIEETIESVTQPFAALKAMPAGLTEKPAAAAATPLFERQLNLADPFEVRRAIILSEILGRPISLRGPGHGVIGLVP